jgi:hypothetical protein
MPAEARKDGGEWERKQENGSSRARTGMEALPVELIGSILFHLADARDVMRASATCRKWRMAARKNLLRLRFWRKDWNRVKKMSTGRSGSWYHGNSDAHVKSPRFVHRLSW